MRDSENDVTIQEEELGERNYSFIEDLTIDDDGPTQQIESSESNRQALASETCVYATVNKQRPSNTK